MTRLYPSGTGRRSFFDPDAAPAVAPSWLPVGLDAVGGCVAQATSNDAPPATRRLVSRFMPYPPLLVGKAAKLARARRLYVSTEGPRPSRYRSRLAGSGSS